MVGTNRDYLKHYIFLVAGLKAEQTQAAHEGASDPRHKRHEAGLLPVHYRSEVANETL